MTRQTLGLLLVLFTASCDTSSFRDCAIACTAQTGCPDGLSCGTEGFCRNGATATSCNAVRDAKEDVDAPDASCVCSTTETLSCNSGQTSCALGCVADAVAHCAKVTPSNGIPLDELDELDRDITIDGIATFDTDSGAITGAVTRSAGAGVRDDIGFAKIGAVGVFTLHALTVSPFGEIRFTGDSAAAFVVETIATIEGDIDASAGCYGTASNCAGPGGGVGADTSLAGGCGPGENGVPADISSDPGGGGGGSRRAGAAGGADTLSTAASGGIACMSVMVEPLIGGSGGGIGSPGSGTAPAPGGGGGGGFQLTALEKIVINGVIDVGGAGGSGGPPLAGTGDRGGGGGAGGGAGGAVLLEAPTVIIDGIVAANGGGGGGAANNTMPGTDGADGTRTTTPAAGGATAYGNGGNGGAGTTLPTAGTVISTSVNGGGGGGGTGAIFVRTIDPPTFTGAVFSPPVGTGALRTQ